MLDVLWAKKPFSDDDSSDVIPLRKHLINTANIVIELWETWLPPILQNKLDKQLLIFLAYTHDIGKASPGFQTDDRYSNTPETDEKIRTNLERAGFPISKSYRELKQTRHEVISHAILKRNGLDDSICVIVGGHHGLPTNKKKLNNVTCSYKANSGFDSDIWKEVQNILFEEALVVAGLSKNIILDLKADRPTQVLLSGMVILADWIASSDYDVRNLPSMWKPDILNNMYEKRFKIKDPRPVQLELDKVVKEVKTPGILVIEAPMGEGKTEAALVAAEILAKKSGCRGIYFALPSQATSNAMLSRVKQWISAFENQKEGLSIRLAHGKADLNEEYEGIKLAKYKGKEGVNVHDWLTGRKKGILADFTIGTIDHILMAGLKQKHLVLRHLGLANKVLIIDECHAYDVYMESYLLTALKWLGAYGVPIIILSATLPTARRTALIRAYLGKRKEHFDQEEMWTDSIAYPLITYTDNNVVHSLPVTSSTANRQSKVSIELVDYEDVLINLDHSLSNGGCGGVIFNTVRKAQEFYCVAVERYGTNQVKLLHSGFISIDRANEEESLVKSLGKNAEKRPCGSEKNIIVGTQIFEQSLDIDFDVMVTELCPMDLLLQRIGRLHRHNHKRPIGLENPKCYVIGAKWEGIDKGSSYIYGDYLLMRTYASLPKVINLPEDIPKLVAKVYNAGAEVCIPNEYLLYYNQAFEQWTLIVEDRQRRAKAFQVNSSLKSKTIMGWLDDDYKDLEGEAAVRDGIDTLEVLLVQQRNDELCFLPWVRKGEILPYHTPTDEQAKAIVGCSVRLPAALNYNIKTVISEIETSMNRLGIVNSWYESYWLKGQLVLVLDEMQSVELNGHILYYDQNMGLYHRKEEK